MTVRPRPRPRLRVVVAGVGLALVALLVASQMLGGPVRYVLVSGRSMEPALHAGDVALVVRDDRYDNGDVVAFRVPAGDPGAGAVVIHRVVGGSAATGYVLRGDNRSGDDAWRPRPEDVLGRMVVAVPKAGLLPATLASPLGLAGSGALALFLLLTRPARRRALPPSAVVVAPAVTAPAPARTPAAASSRPSRVPLVAAAVLGVVALAFAADAARRR